MVRPSGVGRHSMARNKAATGSVDRLRAVLHEEDRGEEIAALLTDLLVSKREILMLRLSQALRDDRAPLVRRISRAEQRLLEIVRGANRPLSTRAVTDLVPERYKSLRHRSHVSTALNSLVHKGVLTKFHSGRILHFAFAPFATAIECGAQGRPDRSREEA